MIAREPGALTDLFGSYVAILAAIPALARFIGNSLIGGYDPVLSGLLRTVIAYAATFTVVYVIAGVIDLLARQFETQKNFPGALKLSIYSHTPVWLAGIFLLVPGLNFLMLLGLYGSYLLWLGLPPLMGVPRGAGAALCAVRHGVCARLYGGLLGDLIRASVAPACTSHSGDGNRWLCRAAVTHAAVRRRSNVSRPFHVVPRRSHLRN